MERGRGSDLGRGGDDWVGASLRTRRTVPRRLHGCAARQLGGGGLFSSVCFCPQQLSSSRVCLALSFFCLASLVAIPWGLDRVAIGMRPPGPLVLYDGTDRGARLGTLSNFNRSHGCLLESFVDTDRGSAPCTARARLCSSLAVVVATRPCVSHHQTYSRWPQVRTRTRAIIPKRVRWPPSASALSRRHHRSIRGPTANVPVVADSAFP